MGRKQLFHLFISLLCLLTFPCTVLGQETSTPLSHAHSTSMQWKGIDVDKVIKSDNDDTEFMPNGKKIYLYNVGTGHFIIEGGNWGVEGRLFHEDFGRVMTLLPTGRINSGITETSVGADKNSFGFNIPYVTRNAGWSSYTTYSYTPIMDGATKYGAYDYNKIERHWDFYRVETDPSADTYTYYMAERLINKDQEEKDYWLGAIYGEWHVGNKDGLFVKTDDNDNDRSVWTSADPRGDMTLKDVGKDKVSIDELYQWRLIDEQEFLRVLNQDIIGINPSVSSLVPDRDFSRNSDDFQYWVTERSSDASYTDKGRLGYTWGLTNKSTNSLQKEYNDEPWNVPVRLKVQVDDKNGGNMNQGWQYSKFCYLSFEGVGKVHTSFKVPNPGWYQIQCYGFCQSADHDAYLYAMVEGSGSTTSYGGISKENLERIAPDTYYKNTRDLCLEVGQELTYNGSNHETIIWICVTDEQYNNGLRTLQIGFGKDAATQSEGKVNGNTTYYYDTDWVCVDDIRVSYMGLAPVFFYEDEESLDYLLFSTENFDQYPSAVPDGRYKGAANLERTFKYKMVEKDGEEVKSYLWNSFSFPIPLTGEQIRYAFGEDAILAKVDGVGTLSKSSQVLDFATVDLMTTENVVEPGHFYLLKPTKEPITGKDPRGVQATYYELGRTFFSVNETEPSDYTFPLLPVGTVMAQNNISSYNNANDGVEYANYIQTPGFETFTVSSGIYNGSTDTKDVYAPKGGYAVSNNTIYHLNKDTRIKGFRGWITLTYPIEGEVENVTGLAVDGIMEDIDETTGLELSTIMPATLPDDTPIYDICGRKVSTLENGHSLPRGIYIVNGKKFMVR